MQELPKSPGVYLWKDADDNVLYVGKAKDLRARTRQYVLDGAHKPEMMEHARDVETIVVTNNKEALILEQTLIKRYRPRYNVRLTDDKSYPYIKLTGGAYPRLLKVHGRRDDGGTYFGPFPDGYGAFHVMRVLNDMFPLRRCKTIPKHKCLYYDIGKCVAPCIDACTDDEYDAVVEEVKQVLRGNSRNLMKRMRADLQQAADAGRFEDAAELRDRLRGLEGVLEQQNVVSDRLESRDIVALHAKAEMAAVVFMHQRDGKIVGKSSYVIHMAHETPTEALADFLRGHYADRSLPRHVSADIPADLAHELEVDLRLLCDHAVSVDVPQRGEKMRWMEVAQTNARLHLEEERLRMDRRGTGAVEALQHALGLSAAPRVIEGFDISHQAGHHTRAAMVRFVDGEPDKSGYRMFGMRDVGEDAIAAGTATVARGAGREVDDFASMEEAVKRRYMRLVEEGSDLPDLIVIDGGQGQLQAAQKGLAASGAHVPMVSIAKREEELWLPKRLQPIKLKARDAGLQLVQRVRDEAHRFGITQVRRKARAAVLASPLDGVAGIGPARKADLVRAFGGLDGLKAASAQDIGRVKGISQSLAEAVVAALAR